MLQIWGPAPGRAKRSQKAQPPKHRDVFLSFVFIWPWWDIDPRCASYTCPSSWQLSVSSSNRTNEGFCSGRFLTKMACLSSSKLERRRHWVDCRHFRAKCVLFIAIARYFYFKSQFTMLLVFCWWRFDDVLLLQNPGWGLRIIAILQHHLRKSSKKYLAN